MYRQRRSGGITTLLVVVLMGIAVGVVYLVMDRPVPAEELHIEQIATVTPAALAVVDDHTEGDVVPVSDVSAGLTQEITYGARLLAPTAGVNSQVVESYLTGTSWDVRELGMQAGHLQGTAWVKTPGNVVMAGHVEMSDGRAGIFARLSDMNIGDPVIIMQDDVEYTYRVTQMFHTAPDDLTVVYPTQTERLTLITCSNYDFFSNQYNDRFIVIAERVR